MVRVLWTASLPDRRSTERSVEQVVSLSEASLSEVGLSDVSIQGRSVGSRSFRSHSTGDDLQETVHKSKYHAELQRVPEDGSKTAYTALPPAHGFSNTDIALRT